MPAYATSNETHYPYSRYLLDTFGTKAYKVVVSSGLTCPTRDGSLGKRGCAFCDVRGSSSYFGKQGRGLEVREQLRKRMPAIRARFGVEKFLAYFQSYTNTYSPDLLGGGHYDLTYLRELYEGALAEPGIAGLCIGTRPDCLPDDVLDLLEELAGRTYIALELGVQSFDDPTLLWLERGHDRRCSIDALERLRQRAPSVQTCVHLIFGSPGEPPGVAREAAVLLNELGVRGAKLHQLMVLEHTELARRYRAEPFPVLTVDAYAELVREFVEQLSPTTYLERLCATASHFDECLAPDWSRSRWEPHNRIRDHLNSRGTRQGSGLVG